MSNIFSGFGQLTEFADENRTGGVGNARTLLATATLAPVRNRI